MSTANYEVLTTGSINVASAVSNVRVVLPSGTTGIHDIDGGIVAQIACTAIAGTSPSLSATLEDSVDGTNWNVVATFTALTAVGTNVQRIANSTSVARHLSIKYSLSGTSPTATFEARVAKNG